VAEKIYVKAYAKARTTKVGELVNLSIDVEDFNRLAEQYANEKGRLKLTLLKRREEGQYGDTHYLVVDTFVPKPKVDTNSISWPPPGDSAF